MGILIRVPLSTSDAPISHYKMSKIWWIPTSHFLFPISHFLLLISHFPLQTGNESFQVGSEIKCVLFLIQMEFGNLASGIWELGIQKWEMGYMDETYIPFLTWHLRSGNGTQMIIPIFKISSSGEVVSGLAGKWAFTLPAWMFVKLYCYIELDDERRPTG